MQSVWFQEACPRPGHTFHCNHLRTPTGGGGAANAAIRIIGASDPIAVAGDNNGRWAGNYSWPLDHGLYLDAARDTVSMLRSHPSILL